MVRLPSPPARVAIVVLALMVGALATEWIVAPWALRRTPAGPSTLAEIARDELEALESGESQRRLTRFDRELGWTHRTSTKGGVATTNGIGARGSREYATQPPPGVLRLVCFGESFVFGHEVGDDATWTVQLEALDERLEVLNFGVSGYGTDQALLRFRRVAPTLAGDVAVLGLNVTSIGRNVNRVRVLLRPNHGRPSVKPRFRLVADGELELVPLPFATEREVLEAAIAGRLIDSLLEHEAWRDGQLRGPGSNVGRAIAADGRSGRRTMLKLWMDSGSEAYRLTQRLVETFDAEARAAGFGRVVVVFFPGERDVRVVERGRGSPWAAFCHELRQRGVDVLDLSEVLAADLAREPLYASLHLNVAGNGAVARHVLVHLEDSLAQRAPR